MCAYTCCSPPVCAMPLTGRCRGQYGLRAGLPEPSYVSNWSWTPGGEAKLHIRDIILVLTCSSSGMHRCSTNLQCALVQTEKWVDSIFDVRT